MYTNVAAQYYSGYATNTPTQYTLRVLYAIEQLGTSVSSQATVTSNTTITWTGTSYLPLSATANVTGKSPLVSCMKLCMPAYLHRDSTHRWYIACSIHLAKA